MCAIADDPSSFRPADDGTGLNDVLNAVAPFVEGEAVRVLRQAQCEILRSLPPRRAARIIRRIRELHPYPFAEDKDEA